MMLTAWENFTQTTVPTLGLTKNAEGTTACCVNSMTQNTLTAGTEAKNPVPSYPVTGQTGVFHAIIVKISAFITDKKYRKEDVLSGKVVLRYKAVT